MISIQQTSKSMILITGIPASGKTYFSNILRKILTSNNRNCLILSVDKIQAIFQYKQNNKQINSEYVIDFLIQGNWNNIMSQFQLNKLNFNSQIWKKSRQVAQNQKLLDFLISKCDVLIIEDQKPLKSQRKPYKKYCYEKDIKYLQIQLTISLQQAIQNNKKRPQNSSVSDLVIIKSYQKFQHNPQSLIIQSKKYCSQIDVSLILQSLKKVHIQDNHTQYINKKIKIQNEKQALTQKQYDENQLRKLISEIMNNQKVQQQYFSDLQIKSLSKKEKAKILADVKKIYIQNKRLKNFKDVLIQYVLKNMKEK